ncbi:hypothetical protein OAM01_00300 [bacterium]|nr:hypothetical protein [bacterium]
MAGVYALIWTTIIFLLMLAFNPGPSNPPAGYHYYRSMGAVLIALGTVCAIGHWLFTRLFWNQRVKGLKEKDSSKIRSPRWVMWLFCFIYIPIFSIATPLAALISVENIRGTYRWHQVRTRLESKGEKLDFSDWENDYVPTEKNINGLPIFIEARENQRENLRQLLNLPERHKPRRSSNHRAPLSMEEWSIAYQIAITNQVNHSNSPRTGKSDLPLYPEATEDADPATIVLKGLSVADELMQEICEASHLPFLRNDTDQDLLNLTFHFSELSVYRSIARFLKLRIQASLTSGDSETALTDLQCAMHLADGMERKLLIEYLVHQSLCHLNASIVWNGLEQHGWKEEQLHSIQKQFEKMEFHEALLDAMAFERTWGIAFMDEWSKPPAKHTQKSNRQLSERTWPRYAIRGITRLSQVALALTFEEWIAPARSWEPNQDAVTGLEFLKQMDVKSWEKRHTYNIHYSLAKMTLPAYGKAFEKSLKAKHAMDSIAAACALERYYLANQTYPETLDVLIPEFVNEIPRDIMDQSILKYQRTEEGFFKLWSIGSDGEDNGGDSKDQKDWVWPME